MGFGRLGGIIDGPKAARPSLSGAQVCTSRRRTTKCPYFRVQQLVPMWGLRITILPVASAAHGEPVSMMPDFTSRRLTAARRSCAAMVLLLMSHPGGAIAETPKEIAKKAFPAVVLITIQDKDGLPLRIGSGFFVGSDLVATNYHVIDWGDRGYVNIIGQKKTRPIKGKVAVDVSNDLAIIAIEKPEPHEILRLGPDKLPDVGEAVYAVGNPEGLEGTFSQGIVSGIRRYRDSTLIQITAPISSGSSGGPVLNEKAEVIGVAVGMIREGQNLNFAIPSHRLRDLTSKRVKPYPLSSMTFEEAKDLGATELPPLGDREEAESSSRQNEPSAEAGQARAQRRSAIWNKDTQMSANPKAFAFVWEGLSSFSFSVKNEHAKPVSFVRVLVIFREASGEPLDSQEIMVTNSILPGLAVRQSGQTTFAVRNLVEGSGGRHKGRIEFRVLSFRFAE